VAYNWDALGLPYTTGEKKFVEICSPDQRPSSSRLAVEGQGKALAFVMEIKDDNNHRLGALVIRAFGNIDTGRLDAHGVSSFTEEEIKPPCRE
jgi:hypothetical protein